MVREDSFRKYDREGAYHHGLMKSDHFYRVKIDKALSLVKPGSIVCDIGCGDGVFLKFAQKIGASVYGIDTSAEGIKLARIYSGCENLCIGSVNSLPLPPSSIDLIVMIDVINYIQDYAGAIREASKTLKTKGQLVIMSPHEIDIEAEKKTIPDSWQKHACRVEDLRAVVGGDLKISEITFIRKPVPAKILKTVIDFLRVSGCLRLLRLITYHKPHNAKSDHVTEIGDVERGRDIYLDSYHIPKSLIRKYETLEFVIIAQKV